ncbi:cyanophycinase [Clostridium saccharobutylicum]|uniref:Cyanophycinase n=1 Tax=Clostridium saccharobutylicum DSM 13864 TaxID=1345695 RepID=U5MPB6_CLOSA|nr:cyanophycinase [Clostridium saccharobutylicum]AGX41511.1 cyanophycinase CphB [Clostridium saccharobutylicum DSM 13864]AQR88791.1 cyanophycinase [Clostridium saccharobutylicum]AQR98690.1 cyanophycinase [Clostridium saccharobutylicum]AQS08412.1 cyanophycinase [Clostridium saccharobutylicum]AQS12680.1 cyanophycinase [Clostridium saccharobutylicum]
MKEILSGNLIIIGGAEDKENKKEILNRVCNSIDKDKDILLVATIATEYPKEAAAKYKKVFKELDVKNIKILDISNRLEAFEQSNADLIKSASLIFFTGGDQLRITSLIGGTSVYDALKEVSQKGTIIVGTSAGASVMSDTMIVQGEDEDSPRKCTLKMAPGLGLIKDVIIDQHFAQRGRIGRLLTGIAQNPEVLGIGIDENTGIVVNKEGIIEVIGEGAVYFIDGSAITHTNVSELYADEILSMHNVKLHILTDGNRFDLIKKSPFEEEKFSHEDSSEENI